MIERELETETDRQTDRQMDGRTDGRTDRQRKLANRRAAYKNERASTYTHMCGT